MPAPLSPAGVIAAVRDGRAMPDGALAAFAAGLATGEVGDAQAGAFAMAVLLRGLGPAGRVALTEGMRDSGRLLRWDLPGPVIDKHSTGGIGDCVSLVLAPLLAAAGAFVPMISGRGLGHSGGTLDKLEAIPGWQAELDPAAFARIVRAEGAAIVAASPDIVPADRRLYAIRDVTGTVESIDLITASILSKKLAAGLGGLVLDVKAGSGAFMKTRAEAETLARALVETAVGAGCPTVALLTGMEEPLAPALGNALEVAEAMAVLEGGAGPLREVTLALGAEALVLAGLAAPAEAEDRLARLLSSGAALERFGRMVAAQGGPRDFTARWREMLPAAPVVAPVFLQESGTLSAVKGVELGRIVVELGGGRRYLGDRIDPAVGLSDVARIGTRVGPEAPVAVIHAADEAAWQRAAETLRAAVVLGGDTAPPARILGRIA
ncbi:thymidine phosphorylase [Haematobacter genomosp. 1]|uniref:Thymidine phosphorylase n=1 Tax=Haematobacter genomosp. 1 TaxID=366618 RepID=A0A212AA58_9RHOB|nr:thymidine phosphorylase [Haematobacter genomosp. 1]OWJ77007.1 thymidine phosphorylase [Haematobacter genomosp. 1]